MFSSLNAFWIVAAAVIAIGFSLWRERSLRNALRDLSAKVERQGEALAALAATGSQSEASPSHDRRRDRPSKSVPKGPTLITVPDLVRPSPGFVEMPAELVDRFGAIWNLADSGSSPDAIARETSLPVGQVELILGLRRTRSAEPRG